MCNTHIQTTHSVSDQLIFPTFIVPPQIYETIHVQILQLILTLIFTDPTTKAFRKTDVDPECAAETSDEQCCF